MDFMKRLGGKPKNTPQDNCEDTGDQSETVVQVMQTSTLNNNKNANLPFGPDTRQLAPGIYVPGDKKTSKKVKVTKKLKGVYNKTSDNITQPSYFCSSVTIVCGSITLFSGLSMTIYSRVGKDLDTNKTGADFLRYAGALFLLIGIAMVLCGLFYCLLVYLRHKGVFGNKDDNKKHDRKPIVKKAEEKDEANTNEKESNVDAPQYAPQTAPQDAHHENVQSQANSQNSIASSEQGITFTTRSEKEEEKFMQKFSGRRGSVFSTQSDNMTSFLPTHITHKTDQNNFKNETQNIINETESVDQMTLFQASNPLFLEKGMTAVTSKTPSRKTNRRQSVAIGVGISKDIHRLKVPEKPVLLLSETGSNVIPNASVISMSSDGKSPRNHLSFKYPNTSNKLPPIVKLSSSHEQNVVLDKCAESPNEGTTTSQPLVMFLSPNALEVGVGEQTITPRIMKKHQLDNQIVGSEFNIGLSTSTTLRRPSDVSILNRNDSFQKYTRNK